ncbi:MAG TPA: gluconate:H+ symporter [Puia sp.]|jgi:Gnt-I system high-affinity gluconate transporter|nr:gluconate:H+ symporter [Puia sp.]
MPLLLSFLGILCLILLILWCKLDTFISFIVVSIALGLACGLDIHQISDAIQKGIGSIMGSLVIILGFGAMLGRLIADSGAAQQITQSLVRLSGIRRIQWAMALSGFLVGLPMFYGAGFMVLMPLVFAVGASTGLPLLYLGVPVLAALSVAHGFLPPHPAATAIAVQLHAHIGKTLLYGIIVGIPTIILAGILFGKTMRRYKSVPNPSLLTVRLMDPHELPGLGLSLTASLMPLILLTSSTLLGLIPGNATSKKVIAFVGDPNIAMLIAVLTGIYLLGLRRGKSMTTIMKSLEDAFKGVAPIMLIIAGAGVFMQVMTLGGVNVYIKDELAHTTVSPLILGWSVAALIRICTGSSTVAGLTTVGLLLPMFQQSAIPPELLTLAIGAGSMTFSHVNDGGFWLFKEYFNLTIRQTFATWTVMETLVSVGGLLMVLLLNQIVH